MNGRLVVATEELWLSPPQVQQIAGLISKHNPDAVALRPKMHAWDTQRLTLLMTDGDLVFMVASSGESWLIEDTRGEEAV